MSDIAERLAPQVAACLGLPQVRIEPAFGGAGNLSFVVTDPAAPGAPPLGFLRCKPGEGLGSLGYTMAREGAILRAAAALGFPVAPVLGTFDAPDALLMAIVHGNPRPDAAEIEVVGPKYLAWIARVHAADATRFPVQRYATQREAVAADLAAWLAEGRRQQVLDDPLLALGARVLAERQPEGAQPPALVHGDVGAGNFLCRDGEITALLDWELAHMGDPHEDLAWLWMRGAHTDFGDPARRFAEYEAAAGRPLERARLDWHVAFVMWKSVLAIQARMRAPVPGELGMIQSVVRLTYDALLGAQLVRLLGAHQPLRTQAPLREPVQEATLAAEMLGLAVWPADQRAVLEYLRDAAAQAAWVHASLADDCARLLGIRPAQLRAHVDAGAAGQLLPLAQVLARHADRRALASPKALRRIERAQRIGLGT